MCSIGRIACGELLCYHFAKNHAIIRERGVRELSSTSPEPYQRDGRRMDWLACGPFVRQRAIGGFYLCRVLSILSYPWSGPRPSHLRLNEGEQGLFDRPWIDHLLSMVSRSIRRPIIWHPVNHRSAGGCCPLKLVAQLPRKSGSSSTQSIANRRWLHRCLVTSPGPALYA